MTVLQPEKSFSRAGGRLRDALVVLPDRVVAGDVVFRDGVITAIEAADGAIPAAGQDVVLPGLVDIHTDHLEKHVYPRAHVRWDMLPAVMAHDAQVIGAGVTTVFDSLCVGASIRQVERCEILTPMLDALDTASRRGMLKAGHLVHLRCEVSDPETPQLLEREIGRPEVRIVSVMDHAPGDRQSPDVAQYKQRMLRATDLMPEELDRAVDELVARSRRVAPEVRAAVVRIARGLGKPLLSHDDACAGHVAQAHAEGIAIAEFPTTIEAARAARSYGMRTVAGAPNFMRGGSQSGNVAVADLLAEGLVDMLASDYVPRSLLDMVFRVAGADPAGLARIVRLMTAAPAAATGLADRGEIAVGKRADLLRVSLVEGHPVLREVYVAGRRVA
jgi:alpha-D-ribose 1-methylphosphonate 5-triphosphate diphosphatase